MPVTLTVANSGTGDRAKQTWIYRYRLNDGSGIGYLGGDKPPPFSVLGVGERFSLASSDSKSAQPPFYKENEI